MVSGKRKTPFSGYPPLNSRREWILGEGPREKGEGPREKGEGPREKGEGQM